MGTSVKMPPNQTSQVELLYRDIKIQMDELNALRPYKAAVEEINKLVEVGGYSEELQEVARILEKHLAKQMAQGEQPRAKS